MKQVIFVFIVGLFLLSCVFGCTRHSTAWGDMDTAEALMERYPDSALAYIDSIDVSMLNSDEEQVRYALLKSILLYKNYIDVDSDSLISVAYDYYKDRGDAYLKERMLSAFNMTTTYYFAGGYEDAIHYGLEAIDLATKMQDTLWMARCNDLTGEIYMQVHAMDLASDHFTDAIIFFKTCGKDKNVIYTYKQLINCKDYIGLSDDCNLLIDSIINLSKLNFREDSLILSELLSKSLKIKRKIGDYSGAQGVLVEREQLTNVNPLTDLDLIEAAKLNFYLDDYDRAQEYINRMRLYTDDDEYRSEYYLCNVLVNKGRGDYKRAVAYYDSLISLQNQLIRHAINQPVLKARGDYMNERLVMQQRLRETEMQRNLLIICCLALVILSLIVVTVYFIRKKNTSVRRAMEDLVFMTDNLGLALTDNASIRSSCNELERTITDLNSEKKSILMSEKSYADTLDRLLNTHIKTINALSIQYFDVDTTDSTKVALFKRCKGEIEIIKNNLPLIFSIVDERNGNVLSEIKAAVEGLRPKDLDFLTMLLAGFNTRIMGLIFDMTASGIYSKRRRLLDKISQAGIDTARFE